MTRWTLATLRERCDEILEIGRQHGVRMIRIFGSISRGDATPASDVDWDAVRAVVENDLGTLRSAVETILEAEGE